MLTVQSENILITQQTMSVILIFRIVLQRYREQLNKFWITMLTLQIGNPGSMGVMSCLGGGLFSLSALVVLRFFFSLFNPFQPVLHQLDFLHAFRSLTILLSLFISTSLHVNLLQGIIAQLYHASRRTVSNSVSTSFDHQ